MNVALVGNQNCGKTTLFNLLTDRNQKTGNWPGVTVSKKEGYIKNTNHKIIDLPGVYSLNAFTKEEKITSNYLLENKVDLIVNVIDATSIKRGLFLTTQLLELGIDLVLVLNMCDQLCDCQKIDITNLSNKLKVSIIKISCTKKKGIKDLINIINNKSYFPYSLIKIFPCEIEKIVSRINAQNRFLAVNYLESKEFKDKNVQASLEELSNKNQCDISELLISKRYSFILNLLNNYSTKGKIEYKNRTKKIDTVLLNKWLAIPIFFIVMSIVYLLAVGLVGSFVSSYLDKFFAYFISNSRFLLSNLKVSSWLVSLICDGIFVGIFSVLSYIPQIIALFFFISILDLSGYLARIAFIFDKIFYKMGLNGKSIVSFIMGTGCSVSALTSSRIIKDEGERKVTIICTPFVPCTAKLPIIALFIGNFFPNNVFLATTSIYFLCIVFILFSSFILKKIYPRRESSYLVELPKYHLPMLMQVLRDVLDKTIAFVKKIGTIILLCSVVNWFLLSFGWNLKEGMVTNIDDSILASIGKFFSWLLFPVINTISWEATVCVIEGIIAKEQIVSCMNVIAGFENRSLFSTYGVFSFFTSSSAYAYCIFCLFSAPCIGAISTMKSELGNKKSFLNAVLFQIMISWFFSSLISYILRIFG